MQNWLNSLLAGLRERKGATTWIWIIILLVVLGIGTVLGLPYERIDGTIANESALGSTGQLVSVFLKWMAVIGLMYVAFIFIRRWQFGGLSTQEKQLAIIERLSLSQKQAILLVRVGNRRILLGATDQSISLLTELGEADEVLPGVKIDDANTLDGGDGFSSILDKKMTGNVSDFFFRSKNRNE